MLHGTHGYFRSMDRILHPWMEYLFMEKGTSSWSYFTRLMGKNPLIAYIISMNVLNIHGYVEYSWIFNGFATTSSNLSMTSPTLSTIAILIIIHYIIALAGDLLIYFITSLSLDLLNLNLISYSIITLSFIIIIEIFK